MAIDEKYNISATATGTGRDGRTELSDGSLSLQLGVPKELGGQDSNAPNPEKLFALGYSACFLGALRVAGQKLAFPVPGHSTVTATIGIGPNSIGGFGISAALEIYLPSLDQSDAERLVELAHNVCPYSNAIKANVDVDLVVRT